MIRPTGFQDDTKVCVAARPQIRRLNCFGRFGKVVWALFVLPELQFTRPCVCDGGAQRGGWDLGLCRGWDFTMCSQTCPNTLFVKLERCAVFWVEIIVQSVESLVFHNCSGHVGHHGRLMMFSGAAGPMPPCSAAAEHKQKQNRKWL